jgi:hypothetical protein
VYENSINVDVSEVLGVQLLGKAVLVCMEEFQGDDNGEGEWNTVVSAETLRHSAAGPHRAVMGIKQRPFERPVEHACAEAPCAPRN